MEVIMAIAILILSVANIILIAIMDSMRYYPSKVVTIDKYRKGDKNV